LTKRTYNADTESHGMAGAAAILRNISLKEKRKMNREFNTP